MADGIDNLQVCPAWPESCDRPAAPLRPDVGYGMAEMGSVAPPLFPPLDLSPPPPPPPPPPPGCPEGPGWSIETWSTYDEGELVSGQVLDDGCGWESGWVVYLNPLGVIALETFSTYAVQDPLTETLDDGFGWASSWWFFPV